MKKNKADFEIDCGFCQRNFWRYRKDKLSKDKLYLMKKHLSECEKCSSKYYDYISEHPEKENFVDIRRISAPRILGEVTGFSHLLPRIKEVFPSIHEEIDELSAVPLAASSEEKESLNFQEIKKEDMYVTLCDDEEKNLRIGFVSKKYDRKGVEFSFLQEMEIDGELRLISIKSGTTNDKGIANLGKIKDIPTPSEKNYILSVSNLKKNV